MSNIYLNTDELRADVWNGQCVKYESLLFVPDAHDGSILPCRLLCRPERVLRVCSGDGLTEYIEGRDYALNGDTIIRLENGRIPYFALDEYYLREPTEIAVVSESRPDRFVRFEDRGIEVYRRQVLISYTHLGACTVCAPAKQGGKLPRTMRLLKSGQPLNMLFYGDSFMEGYDASGFSGVAPYMPSLDRLTALLLSEKYHHPYIRVKNTALGGTTSRWGAQQAGERVAALKPDIALIRFGMNDTMSDISVAEYAHNMRAIIDATRAVSPNTEFLLISSEVPNPDCRGWTGLHRQYEPALHALADATQGCGFVSMGAMFDAAAARKGHASIMSNLLNHPNDFMIRIYASAFAHALGE